MKALDFQVIFLLFFYQSNLLIYMAAFYKQTPTILFIKNKKNGSSEILIFKHNLQ